MSADPRHLSGILEMGDHSVRDWTRAFENASEETAGAAQSVSWAAEELRESARTQWQAAGDMRRQAAIFGEKKIANNNKKSSCHIGEC